MTTFRHVLDYVPLRSGPRSYTFCLPYVPLRSSVILIEFHTFRHVLKRQSCYFANSKTKTHTFLHVPKKIRHVPSMRYEIIASKPPRSFTSYRIYHSNRIEQNTFGHHIVQFAQLSLNTVSGGFVDTPICNTLFPYISISKNVVSTWTSDSYRFVSQVRDRPPIPPGL